MAITNATTLADYASGISTQGATLKVDASNKRVGIGTTNPKQMLQVGTAVSVYGNSGIVSATSFYGDGANLTNVGVDTATVNTDQLNVIGVTTVGSAVTINSTGIDAVSGVITASSFVGGGANITALSGSNIASGTVAAARVATLNQNTSGTAANLSGTPDITVNNITGVAATFTGVLTYEDVTNVDSVGIVTARGGLEVGAAGVGGTVSALGHVEFVGVTTIGLGLSLTNDVHARFGENGELKIYHDSTDSHIHNSSGSLIIKDDTQIVLQSDILRLKNEAGNNSYITADNGAAVGLRYNNTERLTTTNDGVVITGVSTATAIDAAISVWILGASGTSHYTFTGPGALSGDTDPTLQLVRGQKYIFKNRSGGHPFRIQSTVNGSAGTAYNDGVTNNDAADGADLTFDVPYDAPSVLYYQCTSHAAMGGVLYIGSSSGYGFKVAGTMVEGMSSTTTAYNTSGDLNISNGNFHFNSANLGGTGTTLNIMSTTGINTTVNVNEVLNVTAVTAVNATTAFVNKVTIDGKATGITTHWVGGSVPAAGGGSGVDTYSFNILKTGSETYIIVANQVLTSA